MNEIGKPVLRLRDLYDASYDAIAAELGDPGDSGATVQRSPEWLDILIWNVVIAFVVSLSANAAYAALSERFRRRGRVNRTDIEETGAEILEVKVTLKLRDSNEATDNVLDVVYSVHQSPDAREKAERIVRLLSEKVEQHAQRDRE
ncbi:MAG TPA: hypothetical protein VE093_07140 [Polyangiaceae bacterium]|jgi:hypothetical protein|nr:hypothetical protein [Polyangiaceae bacterium]